MLLAHTLQGPVYVFDRALRILVADDDPIMREFALVQLAQPGTAIVTAEDGEDAWEILNRDEQGFDLVLSDLEMPRLGGFGLVERIRTSRRFAHLPAVVITSRDDMFAIDRAFEVGATSFVTKPVNWRLLGYQLRYVMRASRMEGDLRIARDEAERAAELKKSLLALLQHETRTPLHAIIGYAELLQADPGAAQDYVERVLGAARDLSETLRRVFYFAQLSAGTLAVDREEVPLEHLVEEALRPARARAAAAGVEIAVRVGDGPGALVSCDVRHLSTALKELLDNALAHAPSGTAIAVSVGRDGPAATVAIRDQGPGIPDDLLRRCREPFAQGVDPLTRSTEGLGLGLPTAQRIVELHGGVFEVTSTVGEGTCVAIRLPSVPLARPALAG